MRILDISVPVAPGLPMWPGDPPLSLTRVQDMARGDSVNVSQLSCCVHTGTHIDAPLHFIPDGAAVEALALNTLIGPAHVVELPDTVEAITPAHLEAINLPHNVTRLLIKTRNSALWNEPQHRFYEDFVALTGEASAWVVRRGIRLVGVDYLSVQQYHDHDSATHRLLLEAGVIIVEGLDLRGVAAGSYCLVCLPLKLAGSEGAPSRAVLIDDMG